MRKLVIVLLMSAVLLLGLAPSALALERREGTRVAVAAGETVNDDMILSGVTAVVEGTVTGDVFAFAQSVTVTGAIGGNLVVVGEAVDVRGRVDGTVYAMADNLVVAGEVGNSVVSFANDTSLDRSATLGGNWIGFGHRLRAEGAIHRGVLAFARNLRLDGPVSGDVEAWPGHLTLGSSAAIQGSVTYHSAQEAVIESGARTGALKFVPREGRGRRAALLPGVRQAVRFAGFLVVGLVVLALLPGMRTRFPRAVVRNPWQSPLAGLAILVAVPAAAVLLMITIVGAPLGLLSLLLYPVAVYAGQVLVSWTVGRLVADRWTWLGGQHWAVIFLAGALVTTVLTALPVIRIACSFAAVLYGLGGLLYALISGGDEEVAA